MLYYMYNSKGGIVNNKSDLEIETFIESIKSDGVTAEKITDLGYKDSDDLIQSLEQKFTTISKKNNASAPCFIDGLMRVRDWQMNEYYPLYLEVHGWDYSRVLDFSIVGDYLVTSDWSVIFAKQFPKPKTRQTTQYGHYDDDYDDDVSTGGNDTYSKAELDNHSNQCNPNNDAYHSSRR